MIPIIGVALCGAIYAWYLGLEMADTETSIETWISHTARGQRL